MAGIDKHHMDMTQGPLFSKIVVFSIPLILSGVLQLLFNAADLVVIGHYCSHESMAAVGATSSICHLIVTLFIGLSVGTNVLVANNLGARKDDEVSSTVHTAMAISLYGGVVMAILGVLVAHPLLVLTDTPQEVLAKATRYMRIYCYGMPFIIAYNFGSAIMRSYGDTQRPLYYLTLAGILNVALNLLFVVCFSMDVAGVAWATTISQGVSAIMVVYRLMHLTDCCRLVLSRIRIHWRLLKQMMCIGLPAGIQGAFFSISNVTIQASINSFGHLAMAGATAASNLEAIVYVGSYSLHQAALSFVGQNFGAKQWQRVTRSLGISILCVVVLNLAMGCTGLWYGRELLALFNPDSSVIDWGMKHLKILMPTYFTCGIMDVICGGLRGLGHSMIPACITLIGVCAMRIAWVLWFFPQNHTVEYLMYSYPISWIITAIANGTYLWWVFRQLKRTMNKDMMTK